jgi:peptide/nickel transport system permease protein
MFRFVARRVVTSILLLVATSVVVFFVLRLLPGDPVITSLGASPGVSDATIARLRHEAGIDRPIVAQYVTWLMHALRGDLGKSYFSQYPVSSLIETRLWPTFELAFLGVLLSVVLAVPGALWAAHRPRGVIDSVTDAVWTVSLSLPAFIAGIFLTYFLAVRAGLLPTRGYVPLLDDPRDNLRHYVLPSLTLALAGAPLLYRFLRASLLEQINEPYVRTARGKGLTERPVVLRHAARNSLGPTLTMLGLIVGYTLGGAVIIEYVFGIPGLGSLAIESVLKRDYNILQSVVILVSGAFILTSLLVDVAYAALDPRHRLHTRSAT